MTLKRSMCIASLLLSLAMMGCSKQATSSSSSNASAAAPAAAVASGQAWVVLLDSGSYSKAWEDADASMRSTMSQADFVKGMHSIRAPLGKVESRDIKTQRHMTHLPGLPEGDYWMIAYNTSFKHKSNVAETLVLAPEPGGNWRVAGYSLP